MIYTPRKSLLLSESLAESQKPNEKRRGSSHRGLGDVDLYDAIMAHVARRRAAVPQSEWASAPLFTTARGAIWETADVRKLVRKWAVCLGVPPAQVGGKSFRIRGATDVAAMEGAEDGAKKVQQLGRWHSDVSHIYSRAQASSLLDATANMASAEGGSLEALIPEYTQPAWR